MDDPTKDPTATSQTSPADSSEVSTPASSVPSTPTSPTPASEPTPSAPPSTPPADSSTDTSPTQSGVKSSMNMMVIAPLIIIVIAIAVGAVWFMSGSRTSQTGNAATSPVPSSATPAQGLESELNAIDVESDDSEFADVDRDLKSL